MKTFVQSSCHQRCCINRVSSLLHTEACRVGCLMSLASPSSSLLVWALGSPQVFLQKHKQNKVCSALNTWFLCFHEDNPTPVWSHFLKKYAAYMQLFVPLHVVLGNTTKPELTTWAGKVIAAPRASGARGSGVTSDGVKYLLCCVGPRRLFCLAVGSPSFGFSGTCVTGGFWDTLSFAGRSALTC